MISSVHWSFFDTEFWVHRFSDIFLDPSLSPLTFIRPTEHAFFCVLFFQCPSKFNLKYYHYI